MGWEGSEQNIIGSHLLSISVIGEARCLHRAQRMLKVNNHPSNSLFIQLAKDTEEPAAVPADCGVGSFLRL